MFIGHTKAKYALISILTRPDPARPDPARPGPARPGPPRRFCKLNISGTTEPKKLKFGGNMFLNNQFKLSTFGGDLMNR